MEKASTAEQIGFLRVASGDSPVIESFTLVAIPPGMTAADIRTDIVSGQLPVGLAHCGIPHH